MVESGCLNLLLFLLLAAQDVDKSALTIKGDEIKKHQVYLSSDELEGREAGSDGGHKAALYIALQASKRGLKPGGVEGTYFHPFGPTPGNRPSSSISAWTGPS